MVKIYDIGNYFTIIADGKPAITRLKNRIEFIYNKESDLFSILIENKSLEYLNGLAYNDFVGIDDEPFDSLEDLQEYAFNNTGVVGAGLNTEENPIFVETVGTQSSIINLDADEQGTFDIPCKEIYLHNKGNSNILIEGESIGAGLSLPWVGSFSYDTLNSSLLIVYVV